MLRVPRVIMLVIIGTGWDFRWSGKRLRGATTFALNKVPKEPRVLRHIWTGSANRPMLRVPRVIMLVIIGTGWDFRWSGKEIARSNYVCLK